MCGRYTLTDPGDLLEELGIPNPPALEPRYNIAPTQEVAAVREVDEGRELVRLRWGLIPSWAKEAAIGNRMINARSETAADKPSFRTALRRRRCLILTDGFYEWVKDGKVKQPHYIHLADRRPFTFAGLWERWTRGEDGPIESCTILTTEANDAIRPLHHRMPVILEPADRDLWLDPEVRDPEPLEALMRPYRRDDLEHGPVSRLVNSPANDLAQCVEPLRT